MTRTSDIWFWGYRLFRTYQASGLGRSQKSMKSGGGRRGHLPPTSSETINVSTYFTVPKKISWPSGSSTENIFIQGLSISSPVSTPAAFTSR